MGGAREGTGAWMSTTLKITKGYNFPQIYWYRRLPVLKKELDQRRSSWTP